MRCDWLHERLRRAYLACSGLPAIFRKFGIVAAVVAIINPLLTKLVQQDGEILASFYFLRVFMDLKSSRSINTQILNGLGQYLVILTTRLVNNPYIENKYSGIINTLVL